MPYSLGDIASWVDGSVVGDPSFEIDRVRSLKTAGSQDLAFLAHPRYRQEAKSSQAGALLLAKPLSRTGEGALPHQVVVDDPHRALATILDQLAPDQPYQPGIDPSAVVATGANIDPQAMIGPLCVVSDGAQIGPGVQLIGQVFVGSGVVIGVDTVLFPMVSVYDRCVIGNRVRLHSGVVIGGDGFGYVSDASGHQKIKHLGRVVVEDDVEIGANTTVDRALLEDTVIGAGTKIDNLVQVGHNARVGRANMIVAGSAIAGSATLGDRVVMGGHAGVSGHLQVGDDVQIASKCALYDDAEPGTRWGGSSWNPADGVETTVGAAAPPWRIGTKGARLGAARLGRASQSRRRR